ETESSDGAGKDSRATAQNLDGSFLTLQTGSNAAARGAVLGASSPGAPVAFSLTDFESGAGGYTINNGPQPGHVAGLWHLSTGRGAQTGHSPPHSLYFGPGGGPGGGGNYNVGTTPRHSTSPATA